MPAMTLQGRVGIVTGSSRGIGRGIAIALARAGADITVNYRQDEQAAQETAKEIEAMGRRALTFQADVTDAGRVDEMVKNTVSTLGGLDILVNNAGIVSSGSDFAEFRRVFDTHVFGAFHCVRAALPYMRQQKRSDIIFISSVATIPTHPGNPAYTMAKAALEAGARCLAAAEMRNGIRVNVIGPGRIDTDMQRAAAMRLEGTNELSRAYPNPPFGRYGQPHDIGNLCSFLVSEQGSWITGQVIYVDGGEFSTAYKWIRESD